MNRTISWCALLSALLCAGAGAGSARIATSRSASTRSTRTSPSSPRRRARRTRAASSAPATARCRAGRRPTPACCRRQGQDRQAAAKIADDFTGVRATPPPIGLPSGTVAAVDGTVRAINPSPCSPTSSARRSRPRPSTATRTRPPATASTRSPRTTRSSPRPSSRSSSSARRRRFKAGAHVRRDRELHRRRGHGRVDRADSKEDRQTRREARRRDHQEMSRREHRGRPARPLRRSQRHGAGRLHRRTRQCRVCLTLNVIDNVAADCDAFDDGQLNLSCPHETFTLSSPAEPADTPGRAGVTRHQSEARHPVRRHRREPQQRALHPLPPLADRDRARRDPHPRARLRGRRQRLQDPGREPDSARLHREGLRARGLGLRSPLEPARGSRSASTSPRRNARSAHRASTGCSAASSRCRSLRARSPARTAARCSTTRRPTPPSSPTGRRSSSRATSTPIVEKARTVAKNSNVFLGGHSAGTGFAARYAATDFNLTGIGPAEPGYAKLRGLVLLEGGGGSTAGAPLTADTLDRIEAKFDGGLFGAVRDNAGRCVDGTTPCTVATEATTAPARCRRSARRPTDRVLDRPALLNPRILAAVEPAAHPGIRRSRHRPDHPPGRPGLGRQQRHRQGARPGGARRRCRRRPSTAASAPSSTTTARSPSASRPSSPPRSARPGRSSAALLTWHDITEGPMPPAVAAQQRAAADDAARRGVGTGEGGHALRPHGHTFYAGHSNFTDWYYPSSGLSVTSVDRRLHRRPLHDRQRRRGLHTEHARASAASRSTSTRQRSRSAAAGATSRT